MLKRSLLQLLIALGIAIVIVAALAYWAARSMPEQDCDTVQNVHIKGKVTDISGKAISNAVIRIRSKHQLQCRNSTPIDDINITSNGDGDFDYLLLFISEDDTLEMDVTVEGTQQYHSDYLTYYDFKEPLEIELSGP